MAHLKRVNRTAVLPFKRHTCYAIGMTKTSRKANREARKVIKFTRRSWNPAQTEAWRTGNTTALELASAIRFTSVVRALAAGVDGNRLRRALRSAEPRG